MSSKSEKKDVLGPVKEKLKPVFEKIGELTKVQRLLICLITFALIGGVYYYFIYTPKNKELKKAKSTYTRQKTKLAKFKREAAVLLEMEQKMAAKQEEFNVAMKALPDKRELPSLLTGISRAGSDAGLDFLLFQPATEISQPFYKEIPIAIKLEGRYHQITDFFYQVVRLNRIVNINEVEVKSKKEGNIVELSCKAVTYMFVEQKEEPETKRRKKR